MSLLGYDIGHQLTEVRLLTINNWDTLAVTGIVHAGEGDGIIQFIKLTNANITRANTQLGKTVGQMSLGWPIFRVRKYLNDAFFIYGN